MNIKGKQAETVAGNSQKDACLQTAAQSQVSFCLIVL
jgi:hypothetical protein